MTRSEYIALYEKHLNGTATAEELDKLMRYRDKFEMYVISNEDDLESYNEVKERILAKLEYSIGQRKINRKAWWWSAAAAIFLLINSALYFQKKQVPVDDKTKPAVAHNIKPGINKATLTLANGKTLVLTDTLNGQLANEAGVEINKTTNGQIVYAANNKNISEQVTRYNILTTKRSEQFQVILPDGSHVWLDAESSLKYPVNFEESQRVVEMTGQVYFEVAHCVGSPFRVTVKGQTIEDIGTHFNVNAYDDEPVVRTTLTEGALSVAKAGKKEILKPGQEAVTKTSDNSILVANADINEVIAWRNGLFKFNNTPMPIVMRQLSRWYNVDVEYPNGVPKTVFTGEMSRNVNASQVLDILSYFKVHFLIKDGRTGKKIIVLP